MSGLLLKVVSVICRATGADKGFSLEASYPKKHGPKSIPPIEDIRNYVYDWIRKSVWFNTHLTLKLFVNSYRRPRNNFEGVKIIGLRPNTNCNSSLELVIGIPGHDCRFRAMLDCGEGNTAFNLLCVTNPLLHKHLVYAPDMVASCVEKSEESSLLKAARQAGIETLELVMNKWRFIEKRSEMRQLCSKMMKVAKNNCLTQQEIVSLLSESGVDTTKDDLIRDSIQGLSARGVICFIENDIFEITDITHEYAIQWRLKEIEKEKDNLNNSILKANQKVKGLVHKETDLTKKLGEVVKDLSMANIELAKQQESLRILLSEEEQLHV